MPMPSSSLQWFLSGLAIGLLFVTTLFAAKRLQRSGDKLSPEEIRRNVDARSKRTKLRMRLGVFGGTAVALALYFFMPASGGWFVCGIGASVIAYFAILLAPVLWRSGKPTSRERRFPLEPER